MYVNIIKKWEAASLYQRALREHTKLIHLSSACPYFKFSAATLQFQPVCGREYILCLFTARAELISPVYRVNCMSQYTHIQPVCVERNYILNTLSDFKTFLCITSYITMRRYVLK